jgi:release factor glutamine methyltransferase
MEKFDEAFIHSCRKRSAESQEVKFPYFIEAYDMKFQVNEHVFSPVHCSSYRFFIPKLPDVSGQDVLEIGSGHGIVSCYLAQKAKKVVATDINQLAVENTTINAKLNNLQNIETRQSDVYTNVPEKFDMIFWNTPWGYVPDEFENSMTPEEYGMFDPGYKAISKYLLDGKQHLKPNGSLYIGFGHSGADVEQIQELVNKSDLKLNVVAKGIYTPGEEDENGQPIEMMVELWKLTNE